MSTTLRIGFAVVHLCMTAFLAATSWPVLSPALGTAGAVGMIIIIDLHAFLQAAYWAKYTPGVRDFRFWLIIALTLTSGFISFYGAELTATMFEPDSKIDRVQAQIDHYQDSIATINRDELAAYNRRVAAERQRVQREKDRIRKANQENIRILQEQANGMRWSNHVTTAGELAKQIKELSKEPEVKMASIAAPVMLDADEGKMAEMKRRIEAVKSRRQLFKTSARVLEVMLCIVMIGFMFSQKQDAEMNLLIAMLDNLLLGTWLHHVVHNLEGETERETEGNKGNKKGKQTETRETEKGNKGKQEGNKPSQLADNEAVSGETSLFPEKGKQRETRETDLVVEGKQLDTIVSEKPAVNFLSAKGKTVILWNGERWDRDRIRRNWRSNLTNYRKRGTETSLERAIQYWGLWCELMEYTGEEISVDDQMKMNQIKKAI